MDDFQIPVVVEFEFANTDDKSIEQLEIRYMTDLMAVCDSECLADVHVLADGEEYNGVMFYHLLVLISRMDMDEFDSIWFMFSTYNMDGNFFIMEETVAVNDDSSSVVDAQHKLDQVEPTATAFTIPVAVLEQYDIDGHLTDQILDIAYDGEQFDVETTTMNPKYFPYDDQDIYELFLNYMD